MDWQPRSAEDRLLLAYWQRVGGRIYAEVPIGGPGGRGRWPSGCTVRRIDAVRFPGVDAPPGIWSFGNSSAAFDEQLARGSPIEVIEIKVDLDRAVIGQAIAGVDMFERQYGRVGQGIILCQIGDSALEWVCERRSLTVVKVGSASQEGMAEPAAAPDRPRD